MAVRTIGPVHDTVYNAQNIDVSSANITYIPIAHFGLLVDGWCSISAALTTANGVITVKKGTTTLGTITLVQVGSAIGSSYQMVMTGSEIARTFEPGDVLILDGDGACDTTSIGRFSMVIRGL